MKKMLNFKYVIVGFLLVLCGACSDFLDLEPKNKIPGESVLSDPNGIKSFLADLYYVHRLKILYICLLPDLTPEGILVL